MEPHFGILSIAFPYEFNYEHIFSEIYDITITHVNCHHKRRQEPNLPEYSRTDSNMAARIPIASNNLKIECKMAY